MTLFFGGDDSTRIDGKARMHGTGSEDYYHGGWYALLDRWDRGISMPVHGSLDYSLPMNRTGAYRFILSDKLKEWLNLPFTTGETARPLKHTTAFWIIFRKLRKSDKGK